MENTGKKKAKKKTTDKQPIAPVGNAKPTSHKLKLRNTRSSDYESIKEIMDMVYSNAGGAWKREEFLSQLEHFPEGQFCIEDNGILVAAVVSIIVKYSNFGDRHTYD